MPQNAFFLWNRDLLVSQKMTQRHFIFTLHPLSTVIFATATVLAFVLLRNSSFNFHFYTQCEATPTQKSARKCTATSHDFFAERLQRAFTLANQLRYSIPPQTKPLLHLSPEHFGLPMGLGLSSFLMSTQDIVCEGHTGHSMERLPLSSTWKYIVRPHTKNVLHPSSEHSGLPASFNPSSTSMSTQALDTAWTGYQCLAYYIILRQKPFHIPPLNTLAYRWDSAF